MSHHRFTMKELGEYTDLLIIEIIINERLNDLTNPYTPFAERLRKISNGLGRIKPKDLDKLMERR